MATLFALCAIERSKNFGPAADIQPDSVFDASADETPRLIALGAAREATEEDIAVAKIRGTAFLNEVPAADGKPAKVAKAGKPESADAAPLV